MTELEEFARALLQREEQQEWALEQTLRDFGKLSVDARDWCLRELARLLIEWYNAHTAEE